MASKLSRGKYIYLTLAIFFSIRFYDAVFFNTVEVKYVYLTFLSVFFLASLPFLISKNHGLDRELKWIVYSIILSVPVALYTWGQSISDSVIALLPMFPFFFYFYMRRGGFEVERVENIVLLYGLLYVVLYIFQLINYEIAYFGWHEEYAVSRGVIRVIFPGGGLFFLSIFIALCRSRTDRARRGLWLFVVLIGLIVTTMQVTRQLIAALLLVYAFHYWLNRSVTSFALSLVVSALIVMTVVLVGSPIISGMISDVQRDMQMGEDYIRVLAANYYLYDFSPTTLNSILGNGMPRWNVSPLGKEIEYLNRTRGFYLEDVGVVGFYAMFGIFSVVAFCVMTWKMLTLKVSDRYRYIKYHTIFLLVTCVTSDYIFQNTYLIANVICWFVASKIMTARAKDSQGEQIL